MNIVEHVVVYKTAPQEKQLEDSFTDEQTAIDFALDIEKNGGVSVLTRRLKHVPQGQDYIDSARTLKFFRKD